METNYVKNILEVYNLATDLEKQDGLTWYADANKICKRLARKYKQPVKIVCYVMAALSPNNKWHRNITDTERVLDLFLSGDLDLKVSEYNLGNKNALQNIACTYTANLIKAYKILSTRDTSYLKGLKTNNFAQNIYQPKNDNITVDYHAISIALGIRHTIESVESKYFKGKRYEELADAYRTAAKTVGIHANQMQAITWVAWRNLDKVK